MKTIQLIFVACIMAISYNAQILCPPINSPSFQLTSTQVTMSTNGICGAQVFVSNASSSTPGGVVNILFFAPGQPNPIVPIPTLITTGGVWTVTVYELPSGCSTSKTVQINILPAPTITVIPTNTIFCTGQEATLTAFGANNYVWHTGATTSSLVVIPPPTLIYSLTGIGSNGCANVSSGTINVNLSPTVNATTNQNSVCINESIQFSAHGANSYTWNGNSSGIYFTSPQFTTTGIYTYSVQIQGSANQGCVTSKTVSVNVTVDACDVGIEVIGLKSNSNNIKLFPNPTETDLTVLIEVQIDIAKISIINSLGQTIREEEIEVEDKSFVLQTHDLPSGIYQVRVKTEAASLTREFVKN